MIPRSTRPAGFVLVASALLLGCTSGDTDARPSEDSGETSNTTQVDDPAVVSTESDADAPDFTGELTDLMPSDTLGAVAVDVEALSANASPFAIAALFHGESAISLLDDSFAALSALTEPTDLTASTTAALVVHRDPALDGPVVLARLAGAHDVIDPTRPADAMYGSAALYLREDGRYLTLLPAGVLVVGSRAGVESVVDASVSTDPTLAAPITPFLTALDDEADISFVHSLPALFDDGLADDPSLRSAVAVSGAFDVADDSLGGSMAFHTPHATDFVETYNALNAPSTQGEVPREEPLTFAAPITGDIGQVLVPLPVTSLAATPDDMVNSRNIFKKLFAGMEAYDYAERVDAPGGPKAWLDFVVRSEADTPPAAGSVYIRWEFRDEAAIEAFEQNELPAGFRLAPTQFVETDDPAGEYFFALNLYNAGGGSIVSGTRAEWDVFVHGPDGADPNAGERPRFMVVDVLSEEVSADAGNLLTPAQPLSHELVDGRVVSDIRRFDDGGEVQVFSSSFPTPDPDEAEVARFTREMAIGNDYIYWDHGVSDRVLYNATTFNHDAFFVDTTQMTFTDDSRWAQYLKPEVKDAVYYVNDLEYVASPMANLDSEYLDITPEWLAELVGFTTNGHQGGLMRTAVEQFFRGEADPFVEMRVPNETPSTYYHFEITDPAGLEAMLDLPAGHRLAPTTLFDGDTAAYYLTLTMQDVEDAVEGTRAEWSVYTDDGDGRPPSMMIIDLLTQRAAFDPLDIINLPSGVRHELADGLVTTSLASPTIAFDASFTTAGATDKVLALDWIEAGDQVCRLNGICDRFYYDAETLDVPVHRPATVEVTEFSTPWNEFIADAPAAVFVRDNAQEYAVKRWYNLDVTVDELPFSGLADRTHAISGTGTLVGRQSDIADSVYNYSGDAVVEGDEVRFAIDQQIDNALGVGHIFTTGAFDLTTGTGTQTVVDCVGPALLCSDVVNGSTAFFEVDDLDASDPASLSWQVNVVIDLGGSFGIADSASTINASRVG